MSNLRQVVRVMTLTTAAQQVTVNGIDTIRSITFQPDTANSGPIYIGDSAVSSTNYGVRLPTPVTTEPCAPYIDEGFDDGKIRADDYYVAGTNNDKVHVKVMGYS